MKKRDLLVCIITYLLCVIIGSILIYNFGTLNPKTFLNVNIFSFGGTIISFLLNKQLND